MTLFELMKSDAFNETLMAKFLASVTVGTIKGILPAFFDDDEISALFDLPEVEDSLSGTEEAYIKMLNMDANSEWYENGEYRNYWLADVDGSYGENDQGIFFFTPDGKYIEWTGIYLYSDIPFEVTTPTIVIGGESSE